MLDKLFVPYEQAVKLNKLGFNEPCLSYYNVDPQFETPFLNLNKPFEHEWCLPAPLYQQVFDWFREKHDLQYTIGWNKYYPKTPYEFTVRPTWRDEPQQPYGQAGMRYTYADAQIACIDIMIVLVSSYIKQNA